MSFTIRFGIDMVAPLTSEQHRVAARQNVCQLKQSGKQHSLPYKMTTFSAAKILPDTSSHEVIPRKGSTWTNMHAVGECNLDVPSSRPDVVSCQARNASN